ncbi:5'-nucleotidase C-terminal domain-containing protein [Nonomuraea sp. NPDC050451]|uniref:5'-nucleotidase C-terminal domain-containing protein n=1 Tax=Nonomuraea sp. NPDC050451 TaxID=3364364 RepID=UPI0037B439E5
MAAVALASGTLASGAQAAPDPVTFGTVSASPKAHSGDCPTAVTLSTTVKVKAPVTLKYAWTFSDGDRSRARTYKVGGKGLRTIRLSTSLKVTGDARGWGAVRVVSPVKKTSGKASFSVTCTGDGTGTGDTWDSVTTSAVGVADTPVSSPTPAPTGQDADTPAQNLVGKATIAFERTTASKCPVTFKIHGSFEGLPAGAQTVQYRVVGTQEWKTVNVPADHGAVFTTVLETFEWEYDFESPKSSVQIEINQPNGLKSTIIYYFKCGTPGDGASFGVAAEDISRTGMGGPLAELIADAQLEAVQALSGAQVALVSKRAVRWDLKAGPVTFEELWNIQPAGFAVDVYGMTGAQLKKLLAHANPTIGVLTPSASMHYTLTDGVVTELTLNGAPVSDTQVIKIAANYNLMGGMEGFPAWQGATGVYYGGPDDTGALASYIANHSPVRAPAGDRVTVR